MEKGLYASTIYAHYGRSGSRDGVDFYGWWTELEWRQLRRDLDDKACIGWISTQVAQESLSTALDNLLAVAEKVGVQPTPPLLHGQVHTYTLAYKAEDARDYPPPDGWREMLQEEAKRRGWATYDMWEG